MNGSPHIPNKFFDRKVINYIMSFGSNVTKYCFLVYYIWYSFQSKLLDPLEDLDFLKMEVLIKRHLNMRMHVFHLISDAILVNYDAQLFQILSCIGNKHFQHPKLESHFDVIARACICTVPTFPNLDDLKFKLILSWHNSKQVDFSLFCPTQGTTFFDQHQFFVDNTAFCKFFDTYTNGKEKTILSNWKFEGNAKSDRFQFLFDHVVGMCMLDSHLSIPAQIVFSKLQEHPNACLPVNCLDLLLPPPVCFGQQGFSLLASSKNFQYNLSETFGRILAIDDVLENTAFFSCLNLIIAGHAQLPGQEQGLTTFTALPPLEHRSLSSVDISSALSFKLRQLMLSFCSLSADCFSAVEASHFLIPTDNEELYEILWPSDLKGKPSHQDLRRTPFIWDQVTYSEVFT